MIVTGVTARRYGGFEEDQGLSGRRNGVTVVTVRPHMAGVRTHARGTSYRYNRYTVTEVSKWLTSLIFGRNAGRNALAVGVTGLQRRV